MAIINNINDIGPAMIDKTSELQGDINKLDRKRKKGLNKLYRKLNDRFIDKFSEFNNDYEFMKIRLAETLEEIFNKHNKLCKLTSILSALLAFFIFSQVIVSISHIIEYRELCTKTEELVDEIQILKEENKKLHNKIDELSVTNDEKLKTVNTTNIAEPSNLSANELDDIIRARLRDLNMQSSKFTNIGEALVEMENAHKVNALFCLAVGSLESGHGTSSAAVNKNNLFGLMSDGHTMRFSSTEECILYWGKVIRQNYINRGSKSIDSIAHKYCSNPEHWAPSVKSFMKTYAKYVKT